jgi:phosphoglycolate phosphatase
MKNVIFDFDGTIVDSLDFVINMYENWYPKSEHLKNIDKDKLRNMPITGVIEELRIRPWKVPALIIRGRMEMNKNIDKLDAIPGVFQLIDDLEKHNARLFILSSNSSRNINKYLRLKGSRDKFRRVYGGVGILGKAKALKKVIEKNKLNYSETYYVGDEVRDIKAAKKAGIYSIGVTWGYNGKTIMNKENPDLVADKPQDIIKFLYR